MKRIQIGKLKILMISGEIDAIENSSAFIFKARQGPFVGERLVLIGSPEQFDWLDREAKERPVALSSLRIYIFGFIFRKCQ